MGYAHMVGSTENGVSANQRRVSYTLDPIKTSMDTLENQMCEVAVADENNYGIDGHRSGTPL